MQRRKCGNPHHLPKNRKRRQPAPSPIRQQRAPSAVAQPIEPIERARLTLHDSDPPITGNEETLIKQFRAEGYTSYDSVERYLPEWEFVCLNWRELRCSLMLSRPMQRVS